VEIRGLDENLRLQDSVAQRLVKPTPLPRRAQLETIEPKAVFSGDAISDLDSGSKKPGDAVDRGIHDCDERSDRGLPRSEEISFPPPGSAVPGTLGPHRAARGRFWSPAPSEPDAAALEPSWRGGRQSDPEKFPTSPWPWSSSIGRESTRSILPGGEPPGHFGLAVKDYTHSTAPNRRFPDLITQRLLKAAMAGAPLPYTIPELAELAKHCTEREDDATKVERRVRKSAAALLLSGRIGEQFDGLVTGASPKGTWVRVFQPPVEGRLERGFQGLDVGDTSA